MICSLRGATIMLALFLLAMSSAEAKRPRFEIPEIPEAFRDAPAVVLSDANSSIIFVEPPRATVHWKRRRVLLQTPEGLDAADQVFEFRSGRGRHLRSFQAVYYAPGNSRGKKISRRFIQRETAVLIGRKSLVDRVKVTFPGAEVGGVIEWTAEWKSESLDLEHHWYIQENLPRLYTSYRIGFGGSAYFDVNIQYESRQRLEIKRLCDWEDATDDSGQQRRRLACRNIPAFKEEQAAPPERETRLSAVLFFDFPERDEYWDNYGRFLRDLYKPFLEHDPSIQEVVGRLRVTEDWVGNEIDVVHQWMVENVELRRDRDCRLYEPATAKDARDNARGKHAQEDHLLCMNASDVIAAGFGDSYELAFAEYALLKAAGLAVDLVFASDRREGAFDNEMLDVFPSVPMLVVQGKEDQSLIGRFDTVIDTGCRACRPGLVRWFLTGTETAIQFATGTEPHLTRSIESPGHLNWMHRREEVRVREDGRYQLEGELEWSGQLEVERRTKWSSKSEEEIRGELADRLGVPIGTAISLHGLGDASMRLRASVALEGEQAVRKVDKLLFVQPPAGIIDLIPFPLSETRHHPVEVGYSRTYKFERRFFLPPGFEVRDLPDAASKSAGLLNYSQSWERTDQLSVTFRASLTVYARRIHPSHYAALRDAAWEIESMSRAGVLLGPVAPSNAGDDS